MKNNHIVMMVLIAVVVGAGGFFAGMQYEKSQRRNGMGMMMNQMGGQNDQQGGNRMFRGGMGGNGGNRPVMGEIISQDATSITVKMQDGSTKIVMLSDTTSINKSSTGTKADLKTGENVMVIGTTNSDGSVTAQMVSLNSMMRGMMQPSGMPAK